MLRHLYSGVYTWPEVHGTGDREYLWNSYAIQLENRIILVDPLPLSEQVIHGIEALGTPTDSILTCNWHFRESQWCRAHWGCQVHLNSLGIPDVDFEVDYTFQSGQSLWGTIETIHVPGMSWVEETGFLVGGEGGILILGDALCGGRADIGVPDGEVSVYNVDYVPNADIGRSSLINLLEYPFEAVCFAHGTPILEDPKKAIQRFLDREKIWDQMKRSKETRK